eukprot:7382950-Prymnesium_polylepis.1
MGIYSAPSKRRVRGQSPSVHSTHACIEHSRKAARSPGACMLLPGCIVRLSPALGPQLKPRTPQMVCTCTTMVSQYGFI